MTRKRLILATIALGIALGGCSNRSIGNKIDDQFLEPEVANKVEKSHADLASPNSRIVVTAYNGVILLAGQTPRSDLKDKAAEVARSVQGVTKVHNELQVLKPSSLAARSNDAALTTKIKTQMLFDSEVASARIKVITENGIVYLMGLVTRAEGDSASRVVQNTSGVQKIVKLFQYTN